MYLKLTTSLILLLPFLANANDNCDYSVESIQKAIDRLVEFHNVHAFDPTDPKVAVTLYSQEKLSVGMTIPPFGITDIISETGKPTINGFSTVKDNQRVNFEKTPEGYSFFEPGEDSLFNVPLQDLDAELPPAARSRLSKEHLEIFDTIIGLRVKLYALKEKLESKNVLVKTYYVSELRFPFGAGYYGMYDSSYLFLF